MNLRWAFVFLAKARAKAKIKLYYHHYFQSSSSQYNAWLDAILTGKAMTLSVNCAS